MPITKEEYAALRASGLGARQIAFMGDDAARAELRGFRQGQAAVGGAESRIAPPDESAGYSGAPDLPLEEPLFNPADLLTLPFVGPARAAGAVAGRTAGAAGRGLVAGGAGLTKGLASAPVLRQLPGASMVRRMSGDVLELLGRGAGGAAEAPGVAVARQLEAVSRAGAAPVRTKIGQMGAQELAEVPRGAAESRIGGELSERGAKEFAGYARRRAMAMMEQAGLPKEAEASRKAISEILGREVKSRTSLTPDDWMRVTEAANERIMEQAARKAAEKAAASAARKAEKAIPKARLKAVPKKAPTGSAESRVASRAAPRRVSGGPAMEVPGGLEAQLRQSIQAGEAIGRLPPEQQLAAWQMLRQAMGQ